MSDAIEAIAAQGIVPVLRSPDVDDAVRTARACAEAGMRVIELTCTTPSVELALEALRRDDLVLGLGTVTQADQVRRAAEAGATYVVSFAAPAGMVNTARELGLAAIPGAFTPTEVAAASRRRRACGEAVPPVRCRERTYGTCAPSCRTCGSSRRAACPPRMRAQVRGWRPALGGRPRQRVGHGRARRPRRGPASRAGGARPRRACARGHVAARIHSLLGAQ